MSLRYLLEIGAFLESQGRELPESGDVPAIAAETSLGIPSSVSVFSAISPPLIALATDFVTSVAPEDAMLPTLPSEASHRGKVSA